MVFEILRMEAEFEDAYSAFGSRTANVGWRVFASRETPLQTVEKLGAYFHPRLILGISDALPQGGGLEAMERSKLVADWCRSHA